jgi:hypothetical protein
LASWRRSSVVRNNSGKGSSSCKRWCSLAFTCGGGGGHKTFQLGAGIWPSGQSWGLARRQSRFDSRQGPPPYIWMYTPALWVCFGWDIALYKNPHLILI